MSYKCKRTTGSVVKKVLIVYLLVFPSAEVLYWVRDVIQMGSEVPFGLYNTFLAGTSMTHIFQKIYLWFMPLYYMVLINDDLITDYRTGTKNIVICREGKKRYVSGNLRYSFVIPFIITAAGLVMNLLIMGILFRKGTYARFMDERYAPMTYEAAIIGSGHKLFIFCFMHPLIGNLMFIMVASLIAALITMVGSSLSMVLHDRKIAYPLTYALWLIPISMRRSSMLLLQPFSEYEPNTLIPVFIRLIITYLIVIVVAIIWEIRFDET